MVWRMAGDDSDDRYWVFGGRAKIEIYRDLHRGLEFDG